MSIRHARTTGYTLLAIIAAVVFSACSDVAGPSPAAVVNFPPVQVEPVTLPVYGPDSYFGFTFLFYAPRGYHPIILIESSNPGVVRIVGNPVTSLRAEGVDTTRNMMVWRQDVLFSTLSVGRADITASLADNPNMRVVLHIEVEGPISCCKGAAPFDLIGNVRWLDIEQLR